MYKVKFAPYFFRVKYREEQLQLRQEAKQQAKELALEQEQEKERRLDKLRQQVQRMFFFAVYDYVRKANLSKGCWNPNRRLGGNHIFFRDN